MNSSIKIKLAFWTLSVVAVVSGVVGVIMSRG